MELTAEDIKGYLRFSKHNLDRAAETFADEHHNIGEELRKALSEVEKAKANAEVIESEIFLDIQNNPDKYDLAKSPSIEVTKKMVSLDKRYRSAYNSYLAAIDVKNKWQQVKEAHAAKKSMIQAEVSLFNAEYYTIDTSKREKIQKEFIDKAVSTEITNTLEETKRRRMERKNRNIMEEE